MNKRILIPLILALASAPAAARPWHYRPAPDVYFDKARVIEVQPIMEVVQVPTEHRECWTEEVRGSRTRRSEGGMIMGGIIGGVIGNHVSRGDPATTAVSTLIGAAVGNDADRHHYEEPYRHTEHHCQVRDEYYEEERVSGYRVTYRYHGQSYTERMDHDPGKFVRLRVSHTLVD